MYQSNRREHGGKRSMFEGTDRLPGVQILYVGALACIRHRSDEMLRLQKEGRLAFLCLDEVDFVTGDYLEKICAALRELKNACHAQNLVIKAGCQCTVLSTDFGLLAEQMQKELGVPVRVLEGCRLCREERK